MHCNDIADAEEDESLPLGGGRGGAGQPQPLSWAFWWAAPLQSLQHER